MERQSGFNIMKRLIVEVKPLIGVMCITVTMGVLGFLVATSISVLGALAIEDILTKNSLLSFSTAITLMILAAILRGALRYGEQLSGHYIAFRILAILRDKVFTALRKLAPAKLETKDKGNLVSIITSDIELLEVFYAHTIAPIMIAIITSSIMSLILAKINIVFGIVAALFYIIIGLAIPYFSSKFGSNAGFEYRNIFGETNSYLLDSLRGIKEILLFKNGAERLNNINKNSNRLNSKLKVIKDHEGMIRALTDLTIMVAILSYVIIAYNLYNKGIIDFSKIIIAIVFLASSFGPVVALSNLSNNLLHTFACAQRIFTILDEKPLVEEVDGECYLDNVDIKYKDVYFTYPTREDKILEGVSINIEKGEKIAIIGESGTGKSTFIKLLMRFWDVDKGKITIDEKRINKIPTKSLRENQSLVSQETFLFNDTIKENIKVGNENATESQIIEAAKKAAIHYFIRSLPNGYDTKVGELGGNLSSGEKQRIGLARAFLSDAPILILDEPTSNLDTLNEAAVLRSIKENSDGKTVILISHRKSTTAICDRVLKVENRMVV